MRTIFPLGDLDVHDPGQDITLVAKKFFKVFPETLLCHGVAAEVLGMIPINTENFKSGRKSFPHVLVVEFFH